MQDNFADFNSSLSDTDRYDITIGSLLKIKEEMDKTDNKLFSSICNQTIFQILKDSYSHGNELKDVKNRIEQLLSSPDDIEPRKHLLLSINKKIKFFYSKQKSKQKSSGLSQ